MYIGNCNWTLVFVVHPIDTLEAVLCVAWYLEVVLRRVWHKLWSALDMHLWSECSFCIFAGECFDDVF